MRGAKKHATVSTLVDPILQLEAEIGVFFLGAEPGTGFLGVGGPILAVWAVENSITNGPFATLDFRPTLEIASVEDRFAPQLLLANLFQQSVRGMNVIRLIFLSRWGRL